MREKERVEERTSDMGEEETKGLKQREEKR